MKILHVISSVDPAEGGPVEGIKQLGAALTATGNHLEVASLDSPSAPYLKQLALPVHALGPSILKYKFGTRLTPWLRRNRSRYDVVIINGIWRFHSFATWRALRHSDTPYVLFTHGMLDPWFKREYPLKHIKKWMYWPWADYRVLRDAQAVLFTSEDERVLARSSFWLYRCKEKVVQYGSAGPEGAQSTDLRAFFEQYPQLRDKKIALFIGRIHPKKGCDILIDAFSRVLGGKPNWHLVIAGPDQVGWQARLQRHAKEIGVASQITWAGMVRGPVKWGALRAAEFLILPSHQENFGVVVAEALAAGTPTLIANKVNIWREIDSAGAGIVAEDTLEGTCHLLETFVAMPEEDRLLMRQRARNCFEENFDIQQAARTLLAVLANAINVPRQQVS